MNPDNPSSIDADADQPNIPERKYDRLNSSALSYAEYDPETQSMQVTFVNGRTYTHEGVSEEEYDAFVKSPSKGRTWHMVFKGR